jgi:8-oxo-dGTP pyrophosphatase MutT (NUDIX family)
MPPSIPRPAASILLLNPKNQILLMTRPSTPTMSFSGAVVFPGGNYSSAQDPTPRFCAIRELFEECGVLLSKTGPIFSNNKSYPWFDQARRDTHSGKVMFRDLLAEKNIGIDEDGLVEFSRWITPQNMKKRFDAQMYLYFMKEFQDEAGKGKAQNKVEELPTTDGGIEVISTGFFGIEEALEMYSRKEITLFPPQFYLLHVLKHFLGAHLKEDNTAKRGRLSTYLQNSDFGNRTIEPSVLEVLDDGKVILGFGQDGKFGRIRGAFGKSGPKGFELLDLGLHERAKI